MCHSELKKEIGTWSFKGKKDTSQGKRKMSRCLGIRCLPCPADESLR